MLCEPAVRAVVWKVAAPVPSTAPVPRMFAPSRKVTVPVGTLIPVPLLTVAVKITFWPSVGESKLALKEVVLSNCDAGISHAPRPCVPMRILWAVF